MSEAEKRPYPAIAIARQYFSPPDDGQYPTWLVSYDPKLGGKTITVVADESAGDPPAAVFKVDGHIVVIPGVHGWQDAIRSKLKSGEIAFDQMSEVVIVLIDWNAVDKADVFLDLAATFSGVRTEEEAAIDAAAEPPNKLKVSAYGVDPDDRSVYTGAIIGEIPPGLNTADVHSAAIIGPDLAAYSTLGEFYQEATCGAADDDRHPALAAVKAIVELVSASQWDETTFTVDPDPYVADAPLYVEFSCDAEKGPIPLWLVKVHGYGTFGKCLADNPWGGEGLPPTITIENALVLPVVDDDGAVTGNSALVDLATWAVECTLEPTAVVEGGEDVGVAEAA
jgi:hypothetical protein